MENRIVKLRSADSRRDWEGADWDDWEARSLERRRASIVRGVLGSMTTGSDRQKRCALTG